MTGSKLCLYQCEFCDKKFAREESLQKHNCERKKRFAFVKSKKGKICYSLYCYWRKCKEIPNVCSVETYIDSVFFVSFREFLEFSNLVGIPDKKLYIRYMVDANISPKHWRLPDLYEFFIKKFDSEATPNLMAKITVETLFKLSDILDCSDQIHKVFDHLLPSEIARLIHERKLSLWVLLVSNSFMLYLKSIKDINSLNLITSLIDRETWAIKFSENPDIVKNMKAIVKELKI